MSGLQSVKLWSNEYMMTTNVYGAVFVTQKSHWESSLGSRDECRTAPDGRRPLDQANGLEP